MNLPDQPPTFRSPSPGENPWSWGLEAEDGSAVEVEGDLADQRFPTQAEAESWVGEVWADLAEQGVDARHAVRRRPQGLRPDVAARVAVGSQPD